MWSHVDGTVSARPVPRSSPSGFAENAWMRITAMPVPVRPTSLSSGQDIFQRTFTSSRMARVWSRLC